MAVKETTPALAHLNSLGKAHIHVLEMLRAKAVTILLNWALDTSEVAQATVAAAGTFVARQEEGNRPVVVVMLMRSHTGVYFESRTLGLAFEMHLSA